VASLTDDSKGVIYDRNMFVVQTTDLNVQKLGQISLVVCPVEGPL
jgi:hypothetical protein